MKRLEIEQYADVAKPAAFRRLCVETGAGEAVKVAFNPAAFRRLCVETICTVGICALIFPAAFRRLCVETIAPTLKRW